MAAIAPDPTESAAPGWLGSFVADVGAGHRRADRGPRAGHRPADSRPFPGSTPDDVARAAEAAKAAQPAWAATSYQERAARPAQGGRDLRGQPRGVRDLDAARDRRLAQQDAPRVQLRLPRDPQRGDAAVAGVRLAHAVGREGPAVDGPARAGRRHRRDHAVELAVRAGHARRRPGARPRQRRRPQAGPADAGHRRGDVRGGLPRGGPARGRAPGRRRRRGRRRGARHRPEHPGRVVHRLDRRRATGRPARRRDAQEGLARARRQQRVHRPRRRRPRCGGGGRRVLRVPVPGPGLLRRRPAPRPPDGWPTTTPRRSPRRPQRLRLGDPYREDVQLGPIVNEKQLAPGRRHRPALDRGRGARSPRAARTRACSTGRPCSPQVTTDLAGLDRRDLRAGRADHRRSTRDDEAIALANAQPTTASSPRSTRARSAAAWPWPTG